MAFESPTWLAEFFICKVIKTINMTDLCFVLFLSSMPSVPLPFLISYFFFELSSYPFTLFFLIIHSPTKSLTHAHSYFQPPFIHPLSTFSPSPRSTCRSWLSFGLHLPSSQAHSHCRWSVLASLSFPYQAELIWLLHQDWVQTGACQIIKGGSPSLFKSPAPLLLAYVGPSHWKAVSEMRISKNKTLKMTAASNNSE